MADSAFKTQVSRDENANSASNVLFIQLADNAGNSVSVTGGKLDVNASVTLETAYVDEATFTIGSDKVNAQGYLVDETAPDSAPEGSIALARMTADRKILTVITDGTTDGNRLAIDANGYVTSNINGTVTIDDGGGSITVDGSVTVSGTVTVTATDLDIRDLTHVSDSVSIGDGTTLADVLDGTIDALYVAITDGTNVAAIDGSGYLTVNVNGSVTVTATDLDIRDLSASQDNVAISDGTDQLEINSDGSINVNPSPVVAAPVHDYKTATPGAGASDNHDYTVTATKTLYLEGVSWGGSGKEKCEVQVGPVASLVTKYVGFSEKDQQGHVKFTPAIPVPDTSTGTVRVIITNRQGAAVDVYSTIMGQEL